MAAAIITVSATVAGSLARATSADPGYWLVAEDGGVFSFGDAQFHGSTGSQGLNAPVNCLASTNSGRGYWLSAADGGVFSFGDAQFHGSAGGTSLNKPVVGMAATPTGGGYWLVASDGGIFAFGDAVFRGSAGGTRLNQPVVGMAATPTGGGYWLVASDGGIFAFGDAFFRGSAGGTRLNQPIVGMAATPTGGGYWLVASDGGIFAFGDAVFHGSAGSTRLNRPIVGIGVPAGGRSGGCNQPAGESYLLRNLISRFARGEGAPFGIVVADLTTGAVASINEDEVFWSASLYKLFVAFEIYRFIDARRLSFGSPAGSGTGTDVNGCLTLMITISDNGCGRALLALIGAQASNSDLAAHGFTRTDLTSPHQLTTAGDVAHLYQALVAGRLLSRDNTGRFLALLRAQQVNNRLPTGLPAGTPIAHKTGDLDGRMHDAGVVYAPHRTYVVAGLSGPWANPGASLTAFGSLSAQLYGALNG